MNKLIIPIIAVLVIVAGIGAYFILQKPAPVGKCGDGVCGATEEQGSLCSQDCGSNQSDRYSEIISEKIISPQDDFNYWRPEIIVINDKLFFAYNKFNKTIIPKESIFEVIEMDENLNPKRSAIEIYSGDDSSDPTDIRLASNGINLWYAYETTKEPLISCQTHSLNIASYTDESLINKIYLNDVARGCATIMPDGYLVLENNVPIDAEAVDDPTPFYFNNKYYVLTRAWHGQRQHVRVFDNNLKQTDEFILDLSSILGEAELSQNALVDIEGMPYLISGIALNPFFNKGNLDSDIYAIPLDKSLKNTNGDKIPLLVDPSQMNTKVTTAIYNKGYLYINYISIINKESFQYFAVFKFQNNQFIKIYTHQIQQKSFARNHASLAIYNNKLYTVYSGIAGGKEVILANVYNLPKNMSTGL